MKMQSLLASAFILSFILLFAPESLRADDIQDVEIKAVELRNNIAEYNRVKPLQNPRYERSSEILDHRVSDNKNKVVGEVEDILFDKSGQVKSLYVEFDRLNLSQAVYLNYSVLNIKSVSSGYQLGFRDEEIKTLYPALLSNIETASGGDQDLYSLEKVLGSQVVSSDGRILGELEDVLFDSNGRYVRSVYLNINFSTIHNKGVAVPLSILSFEEKSGKMHIVIDEPYVDSILEMAKEG